MNFLRTALKSSVAQEVIIKQKWYIIKVLFPPSSLFGAKMDRASMNLFKEKDDDHHPIKMMIMSKLNRYNPQKFKKCSVLIYNFKEYVWFLSVSYEICRKTKVVLEFGKMQKSYGHAVDSVLFAEMFLSNNFPSITWYLTILTTSGGSKGQRDISFKCSAPWLISDTKMMNELSDLQRNEIWVWSVLEFKVSIQSCQTDEFLRVIPCVSFLEDKSNCRAPKKYHLCWSHRWPQ